MNEDICNLADETGGRAITDTNAMDTPLASLGTELLNYYSLGYRPSEAAGAPHSVTVQCIGPACACATGSRTASGRPTTS